MCTTEILEKSILIVAHPDDEILWFSSILDRVGEVIFCYLDVKSNPQWTIGRKQSLSEYPLRNISYLAIAESEIIYGVDFENPETTSYGIKITRQGVSDKKYVENYYKLKEDLSKKLIGCQNVFTHNPWGEYGNEEHIQVYRTVKELQKELGFNLWFSNYCSNRSFPLMIRYVSEFDSEYVTLKTNKKISNDIINLYKKNGCWTWYDDWKLFDEESFIKDETCQESIKKYGRVFPLNLIKIKPKMNQRKNSTFLASMLHRFKNKINSANGKNN